MTPAATLGEIPERFAKDIPKGTPEGIAETGIQIETLEEIVIKTW